MAESKPQTQTSDPQQQRQQQTGSSLTRRQDYSMQRDPFRTSPFSLMRRFTDEMDRLFGYNFSPWGMFGGASEGNWAPPVEVRERNNNIEVTAELPGLNKEDVKVEATEDGIVIQGEKRREQEGEEGGMHRSERFYGRFYRQIPLPEGADPEKAKAEFKNGILQVQVPISQQKQKTKQIPINT